MTVRMDMLCRVIARALDIIEKETFGASERHSPRVAILCAAMGRLMNLDDDSLSALVTCALFHDNALTEYVMSERIGVDRDLNMRLHCQYGQRNVEWLPFKKDISGFIHYHHERPDGKGPFGKGEGECPLEAELVAVADMVDVKYQLQNVASKDLKSLKKCLEKGIGTKISARAAKVFLEVLDETMLAALTDLALNETLTRELPIWEVSLEDPAIIGISQMVAHVIDYKSVFTKNHSMQIARRSWLMADYYGYSEQDRARLYLAAALHDIGKIATPVGILEKPGKLDEEEFRIIQEHVRHTLDWLDPITGFEDITRWASSHHEKLNGLGYPQGLEENELDFNSRLLACIDIYQAVSEARPYHPPRSHIETMGILRDFSTKGLVDATIVADLDQVMARHSFEDVQDSAVFKELS